MTDDIVTRLRGSCDHLCIGCTAENAHDVGLIAADEIERLRVEVATWKNVAQEITMYAAMQELNKAANP